LAAAVGEVVDSPVWPLPDAELVARLEAVHREMQRLAAVRLVLVREVDGRGLAAREGASSTAVWLRGRLNLTVPATRRLVPLAEALDAAPEVVREALTAGRIDVDQAQVVSAAVAALPAEAGPEVVDKAAEVLVEQAREFDPQLLRRLGERILHHVAPLLAEEAERKALEAAETRAERDRYLTLSPAGDGGVRLTGRLTTEAAAVVTAALDPLCTPGRGGGGNDRSPGQRRADALTDICRLALAAGDLPDHGGDRPQLVVTVPFDPLTQALGTGWLDTATALSPAAVRRLACDAKILPAVLGGGGQVLDVGRERRLFTGPLRRALVLRDRGCAFPGCDRPPRWADGHHVKHWADGGETALHNAVLVCGHHHRVIHAGEWAVHIAGGGRPEFTPPAWLDDTRTPRRNTFHRRL
jgi:hypothetical protein